MKQKPNLRGIDFEDIGIIGIHFFNSRVPLLETLKYLECTSESWTCETPATLKRAEKPFKSSGTTLAVDAGEQHLKKWCIRLY